MLPHLLLHDGKLFLKGIDLRSAAAPSIFPKILTASLRNLAISKPAGNNASVRLPALLSTGIAFALSISAASAAERVALVIGNNAYQNGSPLKNCVNDARAVAAGLKDCGFDVTFVEDGRLQDLEGKLRDFKRAATGAKAAWFYYAGHGAEVAGTNYLIPVDAKVEEEFEVKHETLPLDQVLGAMDGSGAPLKVVVLDCCRDNPFGRGWSRSGSRGLAQVGATPQGTIIAYATAPGQVALDGNGRNSPYTTALVTALAKPGLDINAVFHETGRAVQEATDRKQSPWLNISFYGSFVVKADGGGAAPVAEPTVIANGAIPATGPTVTASGLKYRVLKKGNGTISPQTTDRVKVHYHGTLLNGTVFDSTVERREPSSFNLNALISGWTEGLQLMREGDIFRFEIPPHLAYGEHGAGDKIPPNATLVFEVELLKILPPDASR